MLHENGGRHFVCHKTVDYDTEPDATDEVLGKGGLIVATTKVCAGAMILAAHEGKTSQIQQVAERLGFWNRSMLDMSAPVFKSFAAFVAAQNDVDGHTPERAAKLTD